MNNKHQENRALRGPLIFDSAYPFSGVIMHRQRGQDLNTQYRRIL